MAVLSKVDFDAPPKLVVNFERAGGNDLIAHDRHERLRISETSKVDPSRTHLNEVLAGPKSPLEAVQTYIQKHKIKPASKRQEQPYIRIVLSASPHYFRPNNPLGEGTWQQEQLDAFKSTVMDWLNKTFGDDAVHVALHLDETTPHIHALLVPTYVRKPRKPGKRKKNESEDEFEARVAKTLAQPGTKLISTSKHHLFGQRNSFEIARKSLAEAVAPLGIDYGNTPENRTGDPISDRQLIREQLIEAEHKNMLAEQKLQHADKLQEQAIIARREADEERSKLREERETLETQKADLNHRLATETNRLAQIEYDAEHNARTKIIEGAEKIIDTAKADAQSSARLEAFEQAREEIEQSKKNAAEQARQEVLHQSKQIIDEERINAARAARQEVIANASSEIENAKQAAAAEAHQHVLNNQSEIIEQARDAARKEGLDAAQSEITEQTSRNRKIETAFTALADELVEGTFKRDKKGKLKVKDITPYKAIGDLWKTMLFPIAKMFLDLRHELNKQIEQLRLKQNEITEFLERNDISDEQRYEASRLQEDYDEPGF